MIKDSERIFIMGLDSLLGTIYIKKDGTKIIFFYSPLINIEEGFCFYKNGKVYKDHELLEYIKDFLG